MDQHVLPSSIVFFSKDEIDTTSATRMDTVSLGRKPLKPFKDEMNLPSLVQ
jgi:hypothetical protein